MAIGIDEIDDFENDDLNDILDNNDDYTQHNEVQQESSQNDDDLFMLDFLASKGINDPNNINFEDDNGNITTRSWNDLSREELINILNTPIEPPTVYSQPEQQLSNEEIAFLNLLRSSGVTPEQYIESLQNQEPVYKVDDLSDDELYVLDLESRAGELSEDELAQALSLAKENEDLYRKQVDGIRKEYREREEYNNKIEESEFLQLQQEAYQNYAQNVIQAIDNFNSIGNLDLSLEDYDKDQLASFMLQPDQDGVNYLYKALQDPKNLVKVSWFLLNGDEAFNNISDYFINLIKLVSSNQYKKGYQDALNKKNSSPQVVIDLNKVSESANNNHRILTDADLD